ncbi:hypothetical protein NQ314_010241 [Rhamnusium bicolor]|uniref:Transposase n=1 Tax=Rhamnusium bicolor TaxID=1586634 RepID=A0AAV8XSG6_9CUCU|nr:hypothetical protein NQ314_010241 [Rhamnusium bicolor]
MVRNYKPETNRANIDEGIMCQALRQMLSKSVSQREESRVYGIKRQTLRSRIKNIMKTMSVEDYLKKNDDGYEDDPEEKSKYATRKVFSTSEDNMLVNYLKQCSNMTYQQIRVFVYDYAKVLPGCKCPENWNLGKKAGIEWLRGFMRTCNFKFAKTGEHKFGQRNWLQ